MTEDLPSLVSPAGIADTRRSTDIVDEVNAAAADLRRAVPTSWCCSSTRVPPTPDCDTIGRDPTSTFGNIVNGVDADVDAIVSGHTHLAYNAFPSTAQ